MNAAYLQKKQREVFLQCGVSRTAAKTHLGRQAAAQKGKEAGVSENDIKKQGIWNQGVARGAYDAAIPNWDAIVKLSSRPLSTRAFQNPGFSAESGIYPDISGFIRWNLLAIQCESKTEDTAGKLTSCSGSSWKD